MKPLLLGMNNPISDEPEFDLYPYPEGSAGHRLWRMMPEGTRRAEYLGAFDRLNLLRARQWRQADARAAAKVLLPSLDGRFVVVLGAQVRDALGLPKVEWLSEQAYHVPGEYAFTWVAFPHPSGRNRWLNDARNHARARSVLATIMRSGDYGAVQCLRRR